MILKFDTQIPSHENLCIYFHTDKDIKFQDKRKLPLIHILKGVEMHLSCIILEIPLFSKYASYFPQILRKRKATSEAPFEKQNSKCIYHASLVELEFEESAIIPTIHINHTFKYHITIHSVMFI
jgi:hypothetical protein